MTKSNLNSLIHKILNEEQKKIHNTFKLTLNLNRSWLHITFLKKEYINENLYNVTVEIANGKDIMIEEGQLVYNKFKWTIIFKNIVSIKSMFDEKIKKIRKIDFDTANSKEINYLIIRD